MPSVRRDRLTWLTFAQLGTFGYFLYGFGPAILLLRDEQEVSRAVSGLHGTALASGTLLAGVIFTPLIRRVGRGAGMQFGLAGLAAGTVLLCAAPELPVTLAGALVCGVSGSVVVNGSVAILTAHHGAGGPAAISEANALAAATGLLAPLVAGASVALGLGWRPGVLVATVAATAVWLAGRSRAAGDQPTAAAAAPATRGRLPGRYWLAWLLLAFCVAVEFCLTVWSTDVLRTRLDADPAVAGTAVTTLVAGMLAGRLAGGRLALRMDTGRLLLAAMAVSAGGFAGFWFAGTVWLALAGLAVTGVGIALHFPLGMSRAIEVSGGRADLATGRVSWAVGLASGLAPFALGALADRFGTHAAFLLVPALLAAATGCVLLTGRPSRAAASAAAAGQV